MSKPKINTEMIGALDYLEKEKGIKIVTYMRDRANEFCEQYQHNYSILGTPAEGLSGRFTKGDRKKEMT